MGDVLWMKFVDERIENMQEVLITVGVNGLLSEYDQWLEANGYIKQSGGSYICHKPNAGVSSPGDEPGYAPRECSAIDRSVCHNAECYAPKRNCCAAHLGCEGFETLARVRPNIPICVNANCADPE